MPTAIDAQQLEQIVKSIFATMMDVPLDSSEACWHPGGDRLTATVYLEGDFNGAVSVECTQRQACEFAGSFMSMDPPVAVDDDVRDALGELANMIGGNVKSTMTTGVRLSMPSVVDGHDYELRICGSEVCERIAFHFSGGDFWVTVSMKGSDRSSAAINGSGRKPN